MVVCLAVAEEIRVRFPSGPSTTNKKVPSSNGRMIDSDSIDIGSNPIGTFKLLVFCFFYYFIMDEKLWDLNSIKVLKCFEQQNSTIVTRVIKKKSKDKFYNILSYIYQGTKLGICIAGTGVSLGVGGDTFADIVILIMDASILLNKFKSMLQVPLKIKVWLESIISVKWTGNPDYIKENTIKIIALVTCAKDSIGNKDANIVTIIVTKKVAFIGVPVKTFISAKNFGINPL